MTSIEFEAALDRWGSDLAHWPADAVAAARACLAEHPEARRQLEAAARLDQHLDELRGHRAPPFLAARIVARAQPPLNRVDRILEWFGARLWRPALLGLALMLGGYAAGAVISEPLGPVDSALAEDVMSLAFEDLYAELDDAQ